MSVETPPSIAIIFATPAEAKGALSTLKAKEVLPSKLYEAPKAYLLITGIGSLAASSRVAAFLKDHPTVRSIWNFGLAGSFHDTLEHSSIHPIHTVSKHTQFPKEIDDYSKNFSKALFPPIPLTSDQGLKLLTSDYPLHHKNAGLTECFDVVDMEGYGVAFAAQTARISCKAWKCISDFTSLEGKDMIMKHIKTLSRKLGHFVEKELLGP